MDSSNIIESTDAASSSNVEIIEKDMESKDSIQVQENVIGPNQLDSKVESSNSIDSCKHETQAKLHMTNYAMSSCSLPSHAGSATSLPMHQDTGDMKYDAPPETIPQSFDSAVIPTADINYDKSSTNIMSEPPPNYFNNSDNPTPIHEHLELDSHNSEDTNASLILPSANEHTTNMELPVHDASNCIESRTVTASLNNMSDPGDSDTVRDHVDIDKSRGDILRGHGDVVSPEPSSGVMEETNENVELSSLDNTSRGEFITQVHPEDRAVNVSADFGDYESNVDCNKVYLSNDSLMADNSSHVDNSKAQSQPADFNEMNSRQDTNCRMSSTDSGSTFANRSDCMFVCVDKVSNEFTRSHQENYLRGCKWSPDGTEVVTNSNDNIIRTFTPTGQGGQGDWEMIPNCRMKQSGIVYDFDWYPQKDDSKPETCRIACSCPGNPIHLWDSNNGQIVSSYRAFDHCDELTSAYSLSFSPDGSKLYGGYKNTIRIFDTEYSHRTCSVIKTLDPKTKEGHKGIISCFCHGTPESNTFVTGSYSRHVGVYYTLANKLVCLIQGQQGGVTHISLSPDGRKLYTGGRKDPEIVCWDMRNLGQVCCTYLRDVQTNQRIYFDLSPSGRYLVSGNHDGTLQAWDTTLPGEDVNGERIVRPCNVFKIHEDCVNGVSFHPQGVMLATASGQRHFADVMSDDSDDDDNDKNKDVQNTAEFSLKIWSTPWF